MKYIAHYASPLGPITIETTEDALTGLWFDGQKYFPSQLSKEEANLQKPIIKSTIQWLDEYFAGKKPTNMPKLDLSGTPFQLEVWQILRSIPYGKTISYGDIAEKIAKAKGKEKMSAQAVGGAVGHNPISIIVPCHRVIGTNRKLTGYAGGIDKKISLLTLEGLPINQKSLSVDVTD